MNIFEMLHDEFKFTHRPIRLFEAFSGYGSQFMALKRLGIETEVVGYSEIDKYAIQVYEALHGKHKNYGGIGSFDRLPKDIDICTWSFPCQDISLAGKQRGMEDGSRSNYGYVFLDTVENTPYNERPKVLLMENVKALTSNTFAEDWREIQLRLERLGYTNYADVLNAKDYGVAQNRERVFIVSILGEYYYEFPKPYKLTKRLKDYLEDEVDEKYYLNDRFIEQMTKDVKNYNRKDKFIGGVSQGETIARTITTKLDRPESNYIAIKTWNNETKAYKTREDDMPRHRIYTDDSVGFAITTNESQQPSIMIPEATKQGYAEAHDGDGVYINRPHQKRGVVQKGMIQTIKTGQDVGVVIGSTQKNAFVGSLNGVSPTLTSAMGKGGGQTPMVTTDTQKIDIQNIEVIRVLEDGNEIVKINNKTFIKNGDNYFRIRKLTPREALRLMDVEEHDIDIILSEVSNTRAYQLAGNSIVVNVLVEIFSKLF